MNENCHCPYVICHIHGNCEACVEKNKAEGTLAHCMQAQAIAYGGKISCKKPKTFVEDDFEAMSQKSAELVAQVLLRKPNALLSLPAGSTATRTFEILVQWATSGKVDFSHADFVALDEWLDLEDESENCTAFMRKHLYGPLHVTPEHLTLFDVHALDLNAECKRVDQMIFSHGGVDCMLLGVGMNGHLGLNEPNEAFGDYAKVVSLSPTTMQVGQKYFHSQTKLTRGITLGIRHMFEAGLVILQVGGTHKADIMHEVYTTPPTEAIPATVMQLLPQGVVVMDRDAAAKIEDQAE